MDGVVEADLEARLRLASAALTLVELFGVCAGRLARAECQRRKVVEPVAGGGVSCVQGRGWGSDRRIIAKAANQPSKANQDEMSTARDSHGLIQVKGKANIVHEHAAKLAILGKPCTGLLELY